MCCKPTNIPGNELRDLFLGQGRPSVVFERGCIHSARGLHPIYFQSWGSLEDFIKGLACSNA